ncbi:MAG: EAL domain-containing protein [Nitrosomonadales bacterium]|nr:EAL domain-containing protein [Nitrosomonadales bacterium]
MKPVLRIGDCLCKNWLKVGGFQRYREVVSSSEDSSPGVFAVFSDSGVYMGLVGSRQAALFPNRIFADLLVRRPSAPVSVDTRLDEALIRFREERVDHFAVVDADGRFVGVISELSMFSTLLEQEAQSREEREVLITQLKAELEYHKLATMAFETTSEGVLITDSTPSVMHVNRAFIETTGYSLEDVVGKNPNLLHSGRQAAEFYKTMWQALRETGGWEGEIWNRRKNGEIYPEWLHINSVRDENGDATHYVGVFSDIGPNKEIQRELQQMAYYDTLTGLPNRRLFLDRLERAVAQSYRLKDGFSLLFIDLDRFKYVNDAYGHELGDGLLKTVAQRIRAVVRESDTVARLGGDEFVAILHDCHDKESCQLVVDKIRQCVNEPIGLGGHELNVSAAIGISFYPEDGETVTDIIRNADVAMYRAKEDGMGVCFYQPEMNVGASERLEIEGAIRRGLANDEFWLAWQPQVDLSDGTLSGAEVLARWTHDGQEIPPGTFIPIAESSGLIDMLGDWVFHQAVHEAMEFKEKCKDCSLKIAVNFSPLQLRGEETFHRITEVMQEKAMEPDMLEMEVTESVIMSKRPGAMELLSRMDDLGVSVAVDDFGTGYSNLSNLKQIRVDKLKIDQSFVCDLELNETSRQIVQAVIMMAHSLGLKVVAEGVETAAQCAALREMGCDYGQGYLYSRPVPLNTLKSLCEKCVDGKIILNTANGKACAPSP